MPRPKRKSDVVQGAMAVKIAVFATIGIDDTSAPRLVRFTDEIYCGNKEVKYKLEPLEIE